MQAPDFRRKTRRDDQLDDAEWTPVEPSGDGNGSTGERPREADASAEPARDPFADVGRERGSERWAWIGPRTRRRTRLWLHALLFALTSVSCYYVGGIPYAIALMTILLAHEMGHYVMSLRWRVEATLPFFLPFPHVPGILVSPIGTFGAVIAMRSRMPNRRALLDIGAAGPLAGFVVSVIVLAIGFSQSTIVTAPMTVPPGAIYYVFGESLLYNVIRWLVLGPLPDGAHLIPHQLAHAGWVGLFVTALNLLPLGQLDGGHIIYALDRRRYPMIVLATTAMLIALVFHSAVWTLFAILAVFFGRHHPPPTDDALPLDPLRRKIGYLCMGILVLCFMPNPLDVIGF